MRKSYRANLNLDRLDKEAGAWRGLPPFFRFRSASTAFDEERTLYFLVRLSLLALALTLPIGLVTPILRNPYVLASTIVVGLWLAVQVLLQPRETRFPTLALSLYFLTLPLFAILIDLAQRTPWLFTLWSLCALAFLLWLVDSMVANYLLWLGATPPPAQAHAPQQEPLYRGPFQRFAFRLSLLLPRLPSQAHARVAEHYRGKFALTRYRLQLLAVGGFYAACLSLPLHLRPATISLLAPPLLAVIWLRLCCRQSLRHAWRVLRSTTITWFRYNPLDLEAPGVLLSPAGSTAARWRQTGLVFFLISLFLLPTLRYFPLTYEWAPQAFPGRQSVVRDDSYAHSVCWFLDLLALFNPMDPSVKQTFVRALADHGATHACLNHARHAWPVMLFVEFLWAADLFAFFSLLLSALSAMLFPAIVLFSAITLAGFPLLARAYAEREARDQPDTAPSQDQAENAWERHVALTQNNPNPLLREHLWLGTNDTYGYPVLLHQPVLNDHGYIMGDTGSGKTSRGLLPLITQLIRHRNAPVVIIDLKGDKAMFQVARHEAAQAGLTFKHFTNELELSTYAFNPVPQLKACGLSLNQLCEVLLESLGLNHGDGYGRSYYSHVARNWLSRMLTREPDLQSISGLFEATRNAENFETARQREDASDLVAVIRSLSSFPQLNLGPTTPSTAQAFQDAIHMPDVIENNEVIYFWLPAAIETASVREIAKLALYSLFTSAYRYYRTHDQPKQMYLIIDEFQRIVSSNISLILEQARGYGLSLILSNQSIGQLRTHEDDLRETILLNTRFKQFFGVSDPNVQDHLIRCASDPRMLFASPIFEGVSTGGAGSVEHALRHGPLVPRLFGFLSSWVGSDGPPQEELPPPLTRYDLIRMTDDPDLCLVHVTRGSGYTQFGGYPLLVRTEHIMSKEQYARLFALAWPEPTPSTLVVNRQMAQPPSAESPRTRVSVILQPEPDGPDGSPSSPGPTETDSTPNATAPTDEVDWKARLQSLADDFGDTPKETPRPQDT